LKLSIGKEVEDFLNELSRQVGEMSELTQQQKAASLVRSLIESNKISLSKETVSTLFYKLMGSLKDDIIKPVIYRFYLRCLEELSRIFHIL
jgi:hypothetical protein